MADPPQLNEDVDLPEDVRRYVLEVFVKLAHLSHYQLLGVPRDAPATAAKRAYFQLVRTIHPDRYFGKRLGSYKPKLETIFARLTRAYETLTDAEARAAYDAELAAAEAAAPEGGQARRPRTTAPIEPATAARRQSALLALEAQLAAGKAKAAKLGQAGARAFAAGDLIGAAEAYRQALALTPRDGQLLAAADEVKRALAQRTVETARRQAELEEKHGHWPQAAASWQRVVDALPGDEDARARLTAARARASGQVLR
jgi:curved DNA-binding protein CbpA